ncbi:MAG: hypothetical protein QXH97_00350 [Candidatus Bathyarchaeia archaeon]
MCPDFPRITAVVDTAAIASAVWAYSARTLTGLTGQPRIDIIGSDQDLATVGYTSARAARLDYLDVAVSTRSSHTVADIWTYTTRTLTGLTGQPRIDLLGEDASFEAGTGTRKTLIDRLADVEAFDTPIEGSLTADGTEQNLILDEISGNPQRHIEGYVDLSALASGDTIVIRQYMKIAATGDYVKYAEETYSGAQTLPLLHIITKPARYGLKLTLQQTAGTYRSFAYQFFRKREA